MNRRNRTGTYFPVMVRERILASSSFLPLAFLLLLLLVGWIPKAQAAPTLANIIGEIERITIDNPADHYSGGTIVVGGQIVILPRNLLLDLPANRLTLKQLFDQAPAACVANGETGLAKADACNTSGAGGFAIDQRQPFRLRQRHRRGRAISRKGRRASPAWSPSSTIPTATTA